MVNVTPIGPMKVERYLGFDHSGAPDCHVCRDKYGHAWYIDLMTNGDFCTVQDDGSITEDTKPEDLVGKTIDFNSVNIYVAIGVGVRVVEENLTDSGDQP